MKTIFALAILVASVGASSNPVSTMEAECQRQMELGLCSIKLDPKQYAPGQTIIVGRRRIAAETYVYVRNGDAAMCGMVRRACEADPNGDVCYLGRSRWGK